MSITIDNNTLTQILIRRGTDLTRKQVTLAAGELGYTTDTQRLFIGDGVTLGGNAVSNKFIGYTALELVSSVAQVGDLAFDPTRNNLYVYTTLSGFQVAGINYTGNIINSGGTVNVSTSFAGSGFKITSSPGVLNLDSSYWVASAAGINFTKTVGVTILSAISSNGKMIINTGMQNQFNPPTGGVGSPYSNYDLVINGSTFVNGTLSAGSGSIAINNTGTTSANTLSSFTVTPPAVGYNLIIKSGGQSTSPTSPYVLLSHAYDTTNFAPALYIDSTPFVGINIAKSSVPLTAGVLATFNVGISGNTIFTNSVTVSGDLTADFLASDVNLKTNIKPIANALDKVMQLQGVNFDWIPEYKFTGSDVGVIAQQVESVLPEAVKTRHDGYKGVEYEKIIPLLIEAIKELNNKIK